MQKIQLQIIKILMQVIALLKKQIEAKKKQKDFKVVEDKNEVIYQTAKSLLGQKLITVSKELGCAECINNVFIEATGRPIGGTTSTYRMYNELRKERCFYEVSLEERKRGDVVLSASGHKLFWSRIQNGHCGVLLDDDLIASNNSDTGLLDNHWSLGKWLYYFKDKGGFFVKIFRLK